VIKEAIEKILSLAEPHAIEFKGQYYCDKMLNLLKEPEVAEVKVSTLQGLVDLYANNLDGIKAKSVFAHITGPQTAEIISRDADEFGRRHVWVRAQYPSDIQKFSFGQWLNPEAFVIGLQSCFQRTFVESTDGEVIGDLEYVLKAASNVSAEGRVTYGDDGISQRVEMNKGVVLKEQATLRSRVQLAPFRTFSEIDQPLSTFVFRVHEQNDAIQLALFEADGGRWRLDAVSGIANWLRDELTEVPIIS
jgi:hypothetical protein